MKALVLMHEPDGPAGEIGHRLAERGFDLTFHVVTEDHDRPNEAAAFPHFDGFDLIVPMGSVRSLTRKHEISSWIHEELDLLREAHQRNQPILGICFGGQLLADALGGSVEPSPTTEIGWFRIRSAPGTTNPAGDGPWMEWHHDRFSLPPGAELLAENDVAPQLFRAGRSVGTQFHPEITVEMVKTWLAGCDDEYLAEHEVDGPSLLAETTANQPTSAAACHRFVDWFLDDVMGIEPARSD